MKIKIFYIFFLFFTAAVFVRAQDHLEIVTGKGEYSIPVYLRQGMVYFSVNHFAEVLDVKYNYDQSLGKIELSFPEKKMIVTSKDPFIVLASKDYKQKDIYQLPTSTYSFDDKIYIPLVYSLDILKTALKKDLEYQEPGKLVIKDGKNVISPTTKDFGIYGIDIDEKANGTLVRIKSHQKISAYSSSFKQGILTISLKNVHADISKFNKVSGEGLIKNISANNSGPDTDLKFKLSKEYTTSEVISAAGSNDVLITLHNKIFVKNEDKEKYKEKWDFNVIVIDPGHGGKDAGAIGVNGVKEKDVNLGIALKLGKLIEKNINGVKVVYTRKTDKFVELYKRGKIANEANGNLFISIHCNSTPRKPTDASGFEVYLLRPGRTKEAIDIAERENSVIQYEDNPQRYEKLTDENFILVSMAQSSYMKYSEKFADILNKQFNKDLNIESRGVKQAGFYVLVGAAMPSVLIETGFISNRHDAKFLSSTKGEQKIAESIYQAVKTFKGQYEKSLQSE
ncbi:MAG: N-acetylmuramoyl-L-alanine amidase [Ignavibacteriaceae bacterium]